VVSTRGLKACGMNLDAQAPPAFGTEPWRIEFAPTRDSWMFDHRSAAPAAIRIGHAQMALDSAPIGI